MMTAKLFEATLSGNQHSNFERLFPKNMNV